MWWGELVRVPALTQGAVRAPHCGQFSYSRRRFPTTCAGRQGLDKLIQGPRVPTILHPGRFHLPSRTTSPGWWQLRCKGGGCREPLPSWPGPISKLVWLQPGLGTPLPRVRGQKLSGW